MRKEELQKFFTFCKRNQTSVKCKVAKVFAFCKHFASYQTRLKCKLQSEKNNLQEFYSRTLRISSLGLELGEERIKESFSEEHNF